MLSFHLVVRVLHVVCGAIWVGSVLFIAWFLFPSLADAGPGGAKVIAGVQKRGWIVVAPIIATLTILSGFWLYRPYMANPGSHAAMVFGAGGILGTISFLIGVAFISPTMARANLVGQSASAKPEGPERAALMAQAQKLRQRSAVATRLVSILLIVTVLLMAAGPLF